jgi:hypothetical protein
MNTKRSTMKIATLETSSLPGPVPGVLVALACALSVGCGNAQNDLFDNTRQALAGELGGSCGDVLPVEANTVDVDDSQAMREQCGGGYCLRSEDTALGANESAGMCTCQCAGPEGGGPYCSCASGFECKHLIDDLGFDLDLAGSYCVPE